MKKTEPLPSAIYARVSPEARKMLDSMTYQLPGKTLGEVVESSLRHYFAYLVTAGVIKE